MMPRRGVLGVLAGSVVAPLGACGLSGPGSYKYKMTIKVETPQGIRAFSSVREISFTKRFPTGGYNAHINGEAVVLELPNGPVFALLRGADGDGEYAEIIAEAALNSDLKPGGANRGYAKGQFSEIYPSKPDTVNYFPKSALPLFVRFRDLNDPKSIERVNPQDIQILSITIEKTSDAVTHEAQARLPKPDANGFFNWDGRSNPNGMDVFNISNFTQNGSN